RWGSFFFFEQKTAYESFAGLEFRRVLFRSNHARPLRSGEPESAVDGRDCWVGWLAWKRGLNSNLGKGRVQQARHPQRRRRCSRRSEERRVGKEWSRRTPSGEGNIKQGEVSV